MANPRLAASPGAAQSPLPPLVDGQRLDRPTFHERYKAMPPSFRAELVAGVVAVSSSANLPHAESHAAVTTWLGVYVAMTSGVRLADNGTLFLNDESETQPDAALFIDPSRGGLVKVEANVLVGAPELVVEVSDATARHDLKGKRFEYEAAGVREYVVVDLSAKKVHWFERAGDFFRPLEPSADGCLRSKVFPGLTLDPAALLRQDLARVLAVLGEAMATEEHQAFVHQLSG